MNNPSWWNEQHDSAWDRIKSAMKRDWEQTKADVSSKGHELNQSAGDTIKQALGKEPIPPGNQPNPSKAEAESWDEVESEYRYGVGARQHHGSNDARWDESKLASEWKDLGTNRTWDQAKSRVRRGWDEGSKK